MDEDFVDVTANSHKSIVIFVIAIIVVAICGYFFVFKNLTFSLKTIEVELGESLSDDVTTYLNKKVSNSKEYKLDTSKVKKDEIGEYTYTVTHNKITKKGKIKIVDTTAPKFTLQELTIEEGDEDYYLGDFLSTCDDYSKPCIVTLKNEKDTDKFNKAGTYRIDIVVADLHGNKEEAKADLKVVEKGSYVDPRTQDLEYASNSLKEEDFDGKIYLKLSSALNPISEESRDQMSEISTIDLESYVKDNYPGYKLKESDIIELYNKSSFIIGYSIRLKIDNGKEKVVYVEKDKVSTNSDEESKEE